MQVIFMRHGESKSQKGLIPNNAPDSLNTLTDIGITQVKDAAKNTTYKINYVYSSPYTRTKLTAQTFLTTRGENTPIKIDDRLREIDYGFHGGDTKKHPEMIAVSIKQVNGDYDVRFGRTGENKREIVTRFFEFLVDVFSTHNSDDIILAVTHGRAISITKHEIGAIRGIEMEHGGTKNAQITPIELNTDIIKKIKLHIQQINKTKGV